MDKLIDHFKNKNTQLKITNGITNDTVSYHPQTPNNQTRFNNQQSRIKSKSSVNSPRKTQIIQEIQQQNWIFRK